MGLTQNNSLIDTTNSKNYDHFFSLYHIFLHLDKKYALIKGRNREIIRNFLIWYFDINKNKYKEKLLKQLWDYEKSCENLNPQSPKSYENLNRDNAKYKKEELILEKSLEFAKQSLKLYIKWRKILTQNDILIIAKHNIVDRFKYYFNLSKDDENTILEIIKNNIQTEFSIPRQFLMEFHNAMSHLYKVYYDAGLKENIPRACNHFKRGTLDLHKIIIKDFFILVSHKNLKNDEEIKLIQNKVFQIRNEEYKTIGNDKGRMKVETLFEKYAKISNDIINFKSKTKDKK